MTSTQNRQIASCMLFSLVLKNCILRWMVGLCIDGHIYSMYSWLLGIVYHVLCIMYYWMFTIAELWTTGKRNEKCKGRKAVTANLSWNDVKWRTGWRGVYLAPFIVLYFSTSVTWELRATTRLMLGVLTCLVELMRTEFQTIRFKSAVFIVFHWFKVLCCGVYVSCKFVKKIANNHAKMSWGCLVDDSHKKGEHW